MTVDPENDLLRHLWTVNSVPTGAHIVFEHQCKPVTQVTGLSVPGNYSFTLRAFDDIHMTTKGVSIIVTPSAGTEFNQGESPVKVYPDPAVQYFIIEYSGRHYDFFVVDPAGRIALKGMNVFQRTRVNCSNLDPGIYCVVITDQEGQTFRKKIVIIGNR